MDRKRVERDFLDKAQKISCLIPVGVIVESEGPDFLIKTGFETLGIEVTQLFQPKVANNFTQRAAESFQDKVTRTAEKAYPKSARPVDVLVYFEDEKKRLGCHQMGKSLAEFVQNRYGDERDDTEVFRSPDVPPGFFVISIARPRDGATNAWQAGHSGATLPLEHSFLADEIKRKNKLISRYREKANCVWLLVVASLFPLSASFSVPDEIETWKFNFDFDKVLLLSEQDTEVFELRGTHTCDERTRDDA